MNFRTVTLSAMLVATGVFSTSSVNGQPPGRGEGRGDDSPGMIERLMNFDKDEDGKLSKTEVPERLQSMFVRADKDEDGLLTKDEIRKDFAGREGGPRGEGGPPPGGGRGGEGEDGRGRPSFPVMTALDANGDGELSAAEINNATAALKKLDRNKDGRLDHEVLRPAFGGRGEGRGEGGGGDPAAMAQNMLDRMDKDKDGKLSGDEIEGRLRENLERVDTNSDKVIDKAELTEMAKRFQGGGRGRDGRDGRDGQGGQGGDKPRRPPIEE